MSPRALGRRRLRLAVLLLGLPLSARFGSAQDCFTTGTAPWVSCDGRAPMVSEPSGCSGCSDDFCTRSSLTGGLLGVQPALAEHGIAYNAMATQFYQGVAHGGRQEIFRYGGKVDQFLNIDGAKAGLWEGLFVSLHAETRFGEDSNFDAVGLAPVNANMLYPLPNKHVTSITGLLFTQALSEEWLVSVGQFNLLDLFQQMYPQTGRGIDGFMNISSFTPLSVARGLNLSILGAGITKLREGQVQGSLAVLDTHNVTTTTGLENLYDSGVVIVGSWRLFTEFFSRPGSHALMGIYSNSEYTSVDPLNWAFLPGEGLVAGTESGTWNLTYYLEQKLWVDRADPKRNVGLFSGWGVSDGNPNPIRWSGFVSLQGQGFSDSRPLDSLGASFFYTSLSSEFRQLASVLVDVEDVYGGEIYYNAALTPWFHLTADLQVINPAEEANDTAVVVGVRVKIDL
jgi:porin